MLHSDIFTEETMHAGIQRQPHLPNAFSSCCSDWKFSVDKKNCLMTLFYSTTVLRGSTVAWSTKVCGVRQIWGVCVQVIQSTCLQPFLLRVIHHVNMPKCTELLPCDWLAAVTGQVSLIDWVVSVCTNKGFIKRLLDWWSLYWDFSSWSRRLQLRVRALSFFSSCRCQFRDKLVTWLLTATNTPYQLGWLSASFTLPKSSSDLWQMLWFSYRLVTVIWARNEISHGLLSRRQLSIRNSFLWSLFIKWFCAWCKIFTDTNNTFSPQLHSARHGQRSGAAVSAVTSKRGGGRGAICVPFCVPFACFPCVRRFLQQSGDTRASLQLVARNHPAINWRPVHVVTLPFTPRQLG